jgi:hypothetical protein
MQVKFLSAPFARGHALQHELVSALQEPDYDRLIIVVAWARMSGLAIMEPWLRSFATRGSVEFVVGIDAHGASVEGLEFALSFGSSSFVTYSPTGGTFHPKIYTFTGPRAARLIVGSSNFTLGGLLRNYEASLAVDLDTSVPADKALLGDVLAYLDQVTQDNTTLPLTAELIADLRLSGLVPTEAAGRATASRLRSASAGSTPPLFGPSALELAKAILGGLTSVATESAAIATAPPPVGLPPARLRWFKSLRTASNSGQPNPGSNTTGAFRFTRSGSMIDQTTWFRQRLFRDLKWAVTDLARPTREWADVMFHVFVENDLLEDHPFRLSHDPTREAGQGNFTTDLKWGQFATQLRPISEDHPWVVFDRTGDELNMRFVAVRPGEFVL